MGKRTARREEREEEEGREGIVGAVRGKHLILLAGAVEDGVARVELVHDAPEAPHVDGLVVRQPQQHLRRPVKAALDVRIHLV